MNAPAGVLFLHAHPDDETITTGATMAAYADRGVPVTLVTCTLGEQGEILRPELAGLAADAADQLGGYRIGELTAALAALGVADHRFLGGAGAFRDSGMAGSESARHPRAFWRAAGDPDRFAQAVDALVAVIHEVRPAVLVTYGPDGGYGHPDHVLAHRVGTAAVAAAGPGVQRIYWTVTPHAELDTAAHTDSPFRVVPPGEIGFGVADHEVTTIVDARAYVPAKTAALRAHATQVTVAEPYFALSNGISRVIGGREAYRLAWVATGTPDVAPPDDLLAGLPSSSA